ncbi:hypothetical protein KEM52_005894 [Ascosphaera acerosa]|nr:hypothetical protein KEM52_005894 [Ascosphaera acerosa]
MRHTVISTMSVPIPAETKRYLDERGIQADPRRLAAAVQRAGEIAQRKEVEKTILSRIELLATFPPATVSPSATESSDTNGTATAADIATLKHALVPFQPSDFDDLVAERNVENRCGYPLCAKPPRRLKGPGSFRMAWARSPARPSGQGSASATRQAAVLSKAQFETWCSRECHERAAYLRLQLIERPSWERIGQAEPKFELLEERRARKQAAAKTARQTQVQGEGAGAGAGAADEQLQEMMERLQIGDEVGDEDANAPPQEHSQPSAEEARQAALARERGDKPAATTYYDPNGAVRVIEKASEGVRNRPQPQPPSMLAPGAGAIEGYEPKYMPKPTRLSSSRQI